MVPGPGLGGVSPALAAVLLAAAAASADYNVALDCPYVCNTEIMDGWTGLADGITDSDSGPACFATTNDPQFPKSVTVDLQRPCRINRIAVHNSANGNTRRMTISCSQDGINYESLREFIFPQDQPITLNHRFNDRSAQFVRVIFADTWGGGMGGDNVIFVREVEVFGVPTGEGPVVLAPPQPSGDPLVKTRSLRLLRRYAIDDDRPLTMAVLGDSLADCGEGSWPQVVAERLEVARPEGAHVSVAAMTEEGLVPQAGSGHVGLAAEAEPDLVLVTFGSDMRSWDREAFRAGLLEALGRLLAETDAVVLLIGPVPANASRADIARRALAEMERAADVLGLPMLRTEAALLQAGLHSTDLRGEGGDLSEEARRVIATSVLELLLQP